MKATAGLKVTVRLEPRDAWIGLYVDTERRRLYWCPVPFLAVRIERT